MSVEKPFVWYAISVIVLFALVKLYIVLAEHFQLKDLSTERSSHVNPTPKGAGILLILGLLVLMGISQNLSWPVFLATLALSLVGWWDDWKPLSVVFRLLIQIAAVCLLSYQLYALHESLLWAFLIGFFLLSSINFHNFMDGINGMLLVQSALTLLSLSVWQWKNGHLIEVYLPGAVLMVGVMLYFNFRKRALLFLGDAGSTALGLLLAYLLMKEAIQSDAWPLLFFFSVFFIDAGLTLLVRGVQKKNIFQAHREHLYELLVNEGKQPHLHITFVYVLVQFCINICVLFGWVDSLSTAGALLFLLVLTYFALRKKYLAISI